MSSISLGPSRNKKELTVEQRPHYHRLLLLALRGREDTNHQLCDQPVADDSQKSNAAVAEAIAVCEQQGIPLDQRNSAGESAIFYAAARCFSCFSCLVSHGVNPVGENTWGVSNLNQGCQLLIENEDPRVVEYLIQNKCYPIDKLDDADQTILHQASKSNFPHAIRAIIQQGADINAKDSHQQTALFVACIHGCYESFDVLIELGAKCTGSYDKNDDDETLLHATLCHPVSSRKLIKRLIFMDVPLHKRGCKCKLSKKMFCKEISVHLQEYAYEKYQEFISRKGGSGSGAASPSSSPRSSRSPFRFWRSSGSLNRSPKSGGKEKDPSG